jgi:rhodanese-related sulfurtransferase
MMNTTSADNHKAEEYFAKKNAFTTGPVELSRRIEQEDNIVVIDVRESEDFRKGHVPGAVNLPEEKWDTLEGLSKEATNVLYCYTQTCHLASRAAQRFSREGYPVMEMEGGFEAWKDSDLEIQK